MDPMLAGHSFVCMVHEYSLHDLNFGFKVVKLSKKKAIEGMVDIFLNGIVSK